MSHCNGSINSSSIIWDGRLGAVESCRVVVTRHSQCTCTAMNVVLIGWYMNINGKLRGAWGGWMAYRKAHVLTCNLMQVQLKFPGCKPPPTHTHLCWSSRGDYHVVRLTWQRLPSQRSRAQHTDLGQARTLARQGQPWAGMETAGFFSPGTDCSATRRICASPATETPVAVFLCPAILDLMGPFQFSVLSMVWAWVAGYPDSKMPRNTERIKGSLG